MRVRLTNDSLNSYGTRVLTSGMDIEQYNKNPVLLWMHKRGTVIGYVKDIKKDNGEITGELVFDEATELSKQCKKQFEVGSLRMVSVGIDIIETSGDPALMLQGQVFETITKSKLYEVSLVDIGSNDDALVLKKDGKVITLGKDGENPLPKILTTKKTEMDQKEFALMLGLAGTADETAIREAAKKLTAAKAENEQLKAENKTLKEEQSKLTLAAITSMVDTAIKEKRMDEGNKDKFIELGKQIGTDKLKDVLGAMAPHTKLTATLGMHGQPKGEHEYKKLGDVPEDELVDMRMNNKEEYKRLYKAEFGVDCKI